jgi:hypothetical protein
MGSRVRERALEALHLIDWPKPYFTRGWLKFGVESYLRNGSAMLLAWIIKAIRSRAQYRRHMRMLEASLGARLLSPTEISYLMRRQSRG